MHRTTLGDFELSILSDGTYMADGGAMFGVIPKPMWEKRVAADERNRIPLGLNSLLVRTGEHNVLIDTGIGNKLNDKRRTIYDNQELLLKSFESAGVAPDEITVVINTHLHFDHCGWNTVRQGDKVVPAFPRAKYFVQQGEWEYGQTASERDRISYILDNYNPLVESGRMQLLQGDGEIVPGISVKVFPGHTAHMQGVVIASGGKTACYISDLFPTTAHLDMAWSPAFDLYPLDTLASRKRYYTQAIPERWLTVFTHNVTSPCGYLEKDENGKVLAKAV